MAVRTSSVTVDDLLRLGADDQQIEVVDGELVTMSPVGFQHSRLTLHVAKLFDTHVAPRGLGYVLPDGLIYVLRVGPTGTVEKSRIPDVSFIRAGRIPADFDERLPFPGAPDLAVEIVSPSEGESETLAKVRDYLAHGTQEVWVLFAGVREAHRHLHDDPKTIRVFSGDDALESTVLPDLKLRVSELFDLPPLR